MCGGECGFALLAFVAALGKRSRKCALRAACAWPPSRQCARHAICKLALAALGCAREQLASVRVVDWVMFFASREPPMEHVCAHARCGIPAPTSGIDASERMLGAQRLRSRLCSS